MRELIYFTLGGIGVGGLYASLATGLVVSYRGAGVINFAQGAIATYAAYSFTGLRSEGTIQFPWVNILPGGLIPESLTIGSGAGLTFVPAFVLALAIGTAIMLMAHLLVFRPLRNASPLAKVVGAVGVLLYLQSVIAFHYGTTARQPEEILPSAVLRNFLWTGRSMPQDRLWLGFLAIVFALALAGWYRWSRMGVIVRAVAANTQASTFLGHSEQRVALVSWTLAGLLVSFTGIVALPLVGLDPSRYTLVLVPALAAALVGRFRSTVAAALAGIGIGLFEALAGRVAGYSWFPGGLQAGLTQVVPLAVVLVVMFLRAEPIVGRGSLRERPLPAVRMTRHPAIVAMFLVAAGLIAATQLTGTWSVALQTNAIGIVLMLSLVVLVGYIGQISLAQYAIAGIGAFALMRLMSDGTFSDGGLPVTSGPGIPFPIAAVLAVLVGVGFGVLTGLPALRIRGMQLAIATMTLALAVQEFVLKSPTLVGEGAGLSSSVPRPYLGPLYLGSRDLQTGLNDRFVFTAITVVVAGVLLVVVANIRRSALGSRFLAVRANERAAAAVGINVARTKLVAMAISSAIASIAGVLLAMQRTTLDSLSFDFFVGLTVLAFAFIGGIGSPWGAVLGSLMLAGGLVDVALRTNFEGWPRYSPVIGGALLTLSAVMNPAGVATSAAETVERLRNRRRGGAAVTSVPATPPSAQAVGSAGH